MRRPEVTGKEGLCFSIGSAPRLCNLVEHFRNHTHGILENEPKKAIKSLSEEQTL